MRKYEDVVLTRFPGVPSHMVVDPVHRDLYIADTGAQRILRIHPDSGSMSRSAMVEFPIYSSMSPRFAYELWTCTIYEVFVDAATGATAKAGVNGSVFRPSGLAVSASLLYVAESLLTFSVAKRFTLRNEKKISYTRRPDTFTLNFNLLFSGTSQTMRRVISPPSTRPPVSVWGRRTAPVSRSRS